MSDALAADSQLVRSDQPDCKVVDVAVGILIREDGAFLLTTRPKGKVYAGFWEFPGGKIEHTESIEDALRRELMEEIGVRISSAALWKSLVVDYPHARVQLHFCKVYEWQGCLEMRESQDYSWQQLPVVVEPILPGTIPVLDWLLEERS